MTGALARHNIFSKEKYANPVLILVGINRTVNTVDHTLATCVHIKRQQVDGDLFFITHSDKPTWF